MLPLALGGQARTLPAGVGVRLVEADVADRLVRIDVAHAGERPGPPAILLPAFPVKGRRPTLLLDLGPAVRQPEQRVAVAAVRHEFEVVAVGDQAVHQREAVEPRLVDRHLVVPAPAPLDVAELLQPSREGDPARGRRPLRPRRRVRPVRLAQLGNVAAQDVLELGDQQLLVLLLVVDAGDDQEAEALQVLLGSRADQLLDPAVDRLAEAEDVLVGGARDQPAMVAADPRPERFVVRVHDELEPGVLRTSRGRTARGCSWRRTRSYARGSTRAD